MPLRIGIIGTGGMAAQHARYFGRLRGVRLAACLDLDPVRAQAFAEAHGVARAVASFDDLIDASDAVSVVTPDASHADYSLRILAAGRHLFCEKPLTVTLAEARQVARAYARAREQGVIGMVNFTHRGRHFDRARQLVASGRLGELKQVRGHYLQGWLTDDAAWNRPARIWRLQTARGSGGVLGDLGCHLLDFATGICGDVRRLRCTLRTLPKRGVGGAVVKRFAGAALDANDTAACEIDFAGGAFGLLHTSRWATGRRNDVELEVHGTEAAIQLAHQRPDEPVLRFCARTGRRAGEWVEQRLPAWVDPWKRFVQGIRQGSLVDPDIDRGAEIQSLLDACERSAARGKAVKPRAFR